jgi:hypothetical protein
MTCLTFEKVKSTKDKDAVLCNKNLFSPAEIELKEEWEFCEDKIRKFVLFQSHTMIIFCSTDGLIILSECKRWHADGTFSCVPDGFYQLYITHGWYKCNMIQCAFVLLTGKSADLYRKMIAELNKVL